MNSKYNLLLSSYMAFCTLLFLFSCQGAQVWTISKATSQAFSSTTSDIRGTDYHIVLVSSKLRKQLPDTLWIHDQCIPLVLRDVGEQGSEKANMVSGLRSDGSFQLTIKVGLADDFPVLEGYSSSSYSQPCRPAPIEGEAVLRLGENNYMAIDDWEILRPQRQP